MLASTPNFKQLQMISILIFLAGSICAQAANAIQWINPSSGAALVPGQSVEATWISDRAISNPMFSWCTADARCGQPMASSVIDNDDGTTSAHLTPPDMDTSQGVFLQMSDKDGGGIHQSPSFSVAPSGGDGDAAAMGSGAAVPTGPTEAEDEPSASVNPYKWDDVPTPTPRPSHDEYPDSAPTATDDMRQMDPSAIAAAMSKAAYGQPQPQGQPTAYPSQQPFTNPYAVLNMTSSALPQPAAAAEDNNDRGRPNAAVIAVPLSICGVILIASLLFCVRSRYTRKSKGDLENAGAAGGGTGPVLLPADWQAVVKRKAMEAGAEKGPEGSRGVTVTERREGTYLPTLGYAREAGPARGERFDDPPRYQARRGYELDDDRDRDRDGRDGRSMRYGERSYFDRDRRMRERQDSRDRSSISSRSGTRCITPMPIRERSYDDRYTAAPMLDAYASRSKKRYEDTRRSHLSQSRWEDFDRHSVKEDYYSPTRRSRSGLGGTGGHCDCSSRHSGLHSHSLRSSQSSVSRDCIDCHRPPTSRASHSRSHAHSSSHSHSQSRSSSIDPFADLPGPTYSVQLHEPMIRTQSTSTLARSYGQHDVSSKKSGSKGRPGARRADSSASTITEAGWDLAGKGAYETSHDRGMGELYESLRRAIGESEDAKARR